MKNSTRKTLGNPKIEYQLELAEHLEVHTKNYQAHFIKRTIDSRFKEEMYSLARIFCLDIAQKLSDVFGREVELDEVYEQMPFQVEFHKKALSLKEVKGEDDELQSCDTSG